MDNVSDECLLLSHFITPGSIFLIHIWNRSSWSCLLKPQLFIHSYSNSKFEFWQNDLPHGFLNLKAGYKSPSIIFYNILFLPSFPHFSSHLYILFFWSESHQLFPAMLYSAFECSHFLGMNLSTVFLSYCQVKLSWRKGEKLPEVYLTSLLYLLKVWRHLTARSNKHGKLSAVKFVFWAVQGSFARWL